MEQKGQSHGSHVSESWMNSQKENNNIIQKKKKRKLRQKAKTTM